MLDDYRHQGLRRQLVAELQRKGISDKAVLEAIGHVPRHQFIDDSAFLSLAYKDMAFPIGSGQTISQPYTVAFQSQLLGLVKGQKVLEIGTGCGYQTAVLCRMGLKVLSIERHRPLHLEAKKRLAGMGYHPSLFFGDGYLGLPAHAPFDGVLVTCGAPFVPPALVDQVRVGGCLIVPIGPEGQQEMMRIRKRANGELVQEDHGAFSFVPMLANRA